MPSGIASCVVVVTGGDPTHTFGSLTATATAYDRGGNTTTTSLNYSTLGYRFGGFLQPINDTAHAITTSIFKAGTRCR